MWVHKLTENIDWWIITKPEGFIKTTNQAGSGINVLLNPENKKYHAKTFIGVIHHWETPWNVKKDTWKSTHEWLTEKGIAQIKEVAQWYKEANLNIDNLVIHVPPSITRNVQTARIFCEELWLFFPKEDSIFSEISEIRTKKSFLKDIIKLLTIDEKIDFDITYASEGTVEDIAKVKNSLSKILSEISNTDRSLSSLNDQIIGLINRKSLSTEILQDNIDLLEELEKEELNNSGLSRANYIVLSDDIATAKKWKTNKWNYYPANIVEQNEYGREPVSAVRIRNANYINSSQKENPQKNHIFVVNRAGVEWFLDVKDNRKDLEYKFDSVPWETLMWYLNADDKFINQESVRFFEFNFENYEEQYSELYNIEWLNLSKENSLIENQNIVNEYLENLEYNLFLTKETQEEKELKIRKALYGDNKILQKHTVYALLDIRENQTSLDTKAILINRVNDNFNSNSKFELEEQINYFQEFYNNKENSDLWKYILYKLKTQDNNISDELWDISKNKDVEEELGLIDARKDNVNIKIDTLLGNNIQLKDIYVPQNLKIDDQDVTSSELVSKILTSNKKTFAIQAAGGSGKTMLSKYMLSQLSDSWVLQRNDSSNTFVKNIDLNDYTIENIDTIFQWPENILVIDSLDEKSPDIVKQLVEISSSDKFKKSNKKIIILGRYIEDGFLYKDIKQKVQKTNAEMYALEEEVSVWDYVQSFTKTINPNFQERFKKDLSDMLSKLDTNLHTPIIIEMLANIIKRKLTSWRNKKIFVDEDGNEKTDITRKDIYDEFFKYLHQREDQKTDNLSKEGERPYENNKFMWEDYDELRKDFLMYVINNRWIEKKIINTYDGWVDEILIEENKYDLDNQQFLFTLDSLSKLLDMFLMQKYFNNEDISGLNSFYDMLFEDYIPLGGQSISNGIVYHSEKEMWEQKKNKNLFIKSLLFTNILKQDKNNNMMFHHKTFEEYFEYLKFLKISNWSLEKRVEYLADEIKSLMDSLQVSDLDNMEWWIRAEVQTMLVRLSNAPFFNSLKDTIPFFKLCKKNKYLSIIFIDPYLMDFILEKRVGEWSLSYSFLKEYWEDFVINQVWIHLGMYVWWAGEYLNDEEFLLLKSDIDVIYKKCKQAESWGNIEWNLLEDIQNILNKHNLPRDCDLGAQEFFFYSNKISILRYALTGRF